MIRANVDGLHLVGFCTRGDGVRSASSRGSVSTDQGVGTENLPPREHPRDRAQWVSQAGEDGAFESPLTPILTGMESEVVDARSEDTVSQGLFLRGSLTRGESDGPNPMDWRLFDLVQAGRGVSLPDGFGLPVGAGARLDFHSMIGGEETEAHHDNVRLRTRIMWRRADEGIRPVFRRSLTMGSSKWSRERAKSGARVEALCELHWSSTCRIWNALAARQTVPCLGVEKPYFWMVPPGEHVYRKEITDQLDLPADSTAHHLSARLHPFARARCA